eukprot:1160786-Pelagomonas_calceolata.AAC.11
MEDAQGADCADCLSAACRRPRTAVMHARGHHTGKITNALLLEILTRKLRTKRKHAELWIAVVPALKAHGKSRRRPSEEDSTPKATGAA